MTYVAPKPIRLYALAAKLEVTYGTDPVPTAATNAVRLARPLWPLLIPTMEWANLRDDVANNSFIPLAAAAAHGQKVKLQIPWELKGVGAAYTGANFADADPLLQSSGWAASFAAATETYAPVTTAARPSCTVYGWGGGNLYKVSGVRGNFEARILAGRICLVTFTMEGFLTALPLATAVPATTYQAVIPPAAVSQTCTIGPWSPDYDDIVFRTMNDCQWLYSGNATDGLQSYDFGVSRPELEISARAVDQGTIEPTTDWAAATARAFTCQVGTATGNKHILSDSAIWIPQEWAPEDYKNFGAWRAKYRCTAPQLAMS